MFLELFKGSFIQELFLALICDYSLIIVRSCWSSSQTKSYGILGQIFGLISFSLIIRRLWVVLNGKSSQEYPVNAGILQGSILGPTLFLLYINHLPDDAICKIAINADDTAL